MTEWTKIEDPLWEVDEFIDVVLDRAFILDILDKWGIEYAPCRSGDFSHRSKCPFPKHLDGGERTASLFISEEKNSFYCYGCNSGGNVINFVELYTGKPFHLAAKWLAGQVGITKDNVSDNLENVSRNRKRDPEEQVITHVFRTGIIIRNFLKDMRGSPNYQKIKEWSDRRFVKLDKFLNNLGDDDWEVAKKYYDKVADYLQRRQK